MSLRIGKQIRQPLGPRSTEVLSPLEYLHLCWRKVSPDDRLRFLAEMLTPNERRALQCGFEEEETTP